MKVLITGAAGGIGSTLSHQIKRFGYDVLLVDNLRNGYIENLKSDGVMPGRFFKMDINSPHFDSLVRDEKPDVIIHLAAITSLPDCETDFNECIKVNVGGTASVIEAAKKYGVNRVIFSSTSAVYENTKLNETSGFLEDDPISPRLFYSLSKKMAEEVCFSFIQNYGMDIIILRFFNVFGPKQDMHRKSPPLINYLVREYTSQRSPILHSNGDQARDYVYSEDVADLIHICITKEKFKERIFNVCSGTTLSVREIAECVKKGLGVSREIAETYRDSNKLWDSYPELFNGFFPLSKDVVEKETNKKSLGSNKKAKEILEWSPRSNIKSLISEVSKQMGLKKL